MKKVEDVKRKDKKSEEIEENDNETEDFVMKEVEPVKDFAEYPSPPKVIFREDVREKEPSEKVKVKFAKFVQMVATHDFEEIIKKRADEEIVVSSDLLTELAISHEEEGENDGKLPILMVAAFVIGVVLTWLVIKY